MQLERPVIQLIKHRNGRMNYEEVLRLGKGAPGGKSPLVDFHNVRMNGGTLRIALPWNPDRSLRTQAQKDSALQAERAKPGRTIEESPEGLRRIILLADLTTRMSRLRIATPDRQPFTIDLDSLATRINDPGGHRCATRPAASCSAATARSSASRGARFPTPGSPAAAPSPGRATPSSTTSR